MYVTIMLHAYYIYIIDINNVDEYYKAVSLVFSRDDKL